MHHLECNGLFCSFHVLNIFFQQIWLIASVFFLAICQWSSYIGTLGRKESLQILLTFLPSTVSTHLWKKSAGFGRVFVCVSLNWPRCFLCERQWMDGWMEGRKKDVFSWSSFGMSVVWNGYMRYASPCYIFSLSFLLSLSIFLSVAMGSCQPDTPQMPITQSSRRAVLKYYAHSWVSAASYMKHIPKLQWWLVLLTSITAFFFFFFFFFLFIDLRFNSQKPLHYPLQITCWMTHYNIRDILYVCVLSGNLADY